MPIDAIIGAEPYKQAQQRNRNHEKQKGLFENLFQIKLNCGLDKFHRFKELDKGTTVILCKENDNSVNKSISKLKKGMKKKLELKNKEKE